MELIKQDDEYDNNTIKGKKKCLLQYSGIIINGSYYP